MQSTLYKDMTTTNIHLQTTINFTANNNQVTRWFVLINWCLTYETNAASSSSEHFLVRVIHADYFDPSEVPSRLCRHAFRDGLEFHVTLRP